MTNSAPSAGPLIEPVLAGLASVVAGLRPDRFSDPTPCSGFDVAALRTHVLAWVNHYGIAFSDPDGTGERPDPAAFEAPDDAAAAVEVVRTAAARIAAAVGEGVADREVKLVRASMPGEMSLRLVLWDTLVHSWDLARAGGQSFDPPEAAARNALDFAPGMLTDEYRGPEKDFGARVPAPDDAPALDRLLGFSGRDPGWKA